MHTFLRLIFEGYKTNSLPVIGHIHFLSPFINIMVSGYFAAYSAIGTSIVSLLACMVFVPAIYMKVSSVQSMLEVDGAEFRIMANEAWEGMMSARSEAPTAGRQKRQYGYTNNYGSSNYPPPSAGPALCRKYRKQLPQQSYQRSTHANFQNRIM